MSVSLLWIPALLLIAVGFWWLRRTPAQSPKPASRRLAPVAPPQQPRPAVAGAPVAAARAAEPEPESLATFSWRDAHDMDAEHRETLLTAIKGIPRPPRSMQQLLSPEFVARANSTELSELVMGEPLIAGKVLATVNSPLFGLRQPVTNIGQAVTFLGMSTVRSICLQYMLAEAFKPKLADIQKAFDAIWKASAIASELAVRLGKALNLPDQGNLATQVVLSFVGQLATASLIPASSMRSWLERDRLERARLEQELLGLNATEIGGLLMQSWELPAALVSDVNRIGQQLVADGASDLQPAAPRLAIGYLCARLGERLALGQQPSLDGYNPLQDGDADTHHLRQRLQHPSLARLPQTLASPNLQAAIHQMLAHPAR